MERLSQSPQRSDVVKEQFNRREATTRKKIESICRGEDRPCTQNEDYFFHCRSELLVKYKATYRRSKGHGSIFGFTSESPRDQQRLVNEAVAALARLGLHGLKAEDLVKLFPESRMDPALEIMSEARAYFQGMKSDYRSSYRVGTSSYFVLSCSCIQAVWGQHP